MMDFPSVKVTVVDCHQLDRYIFEEYHMETNTLHYCTDLWDGMGQNSYVEFDVNKYGPESCWQVEEWTADIGIESIQEWLKGDREFDVELVLWHLMHQDKITKGKYLIKLWW